MKIPEHLALSYLLAQLGVEQTFGSGGTMLMLLAGLLPDLDGVSILGGWECHRKYHRKVGHGLPTTLLGAAGLTLLAMPALGPRPGGEWLILWAWLQLSVMLHLLVDLLFYRWQVQLLWPVSNWGLGVGLVEWNDLVPTLLLYVAAALAAAFPQQALWSAAGGLGLLGAYLWRRWSRPRSPLGWRAWLTGNWARRSPRVCRWLTGDFIT